MFNVLQIKLGMGSIPGMTNHCTQSKDTFSQSSGQFHILNLVHIAIIFHFFEKPAVDGQNFLSHQILGKGEWQSKKQPALPLLKSHVFIYLFHLHTLL